jgi:hypothetical protein
MSVSEQIIQVIDTLCEKFGIVMDWTGDNVIPYIEILGKKLITYELSTSVAWIVVMLFLSIGSIITMKKVYPFFKKKIAEGTVSYSSVCQNDWDVGLVLAIIGTIAINVVAVIVIICQAFDIIKCLAFPEMYIFEYISRFIAQ